MKIQEGEKAALIALRHYHNTHLAYNKAHVQTLLYISYKYYSKHYRKVISLGAFNA